MKNTIVYGVDPGTLETGFVLWDGKKVVECGIEPNEVFLERLRSSEKSGPPLYVEMIASFGMPVGKETFQTVLWIGRFVEVWSIFGYPWQLCYRIQIKNHHCGSSKAKDSNISQALRDKYGQVGTKKAKGPLFGVKKHIWSALAVAAYAVETKMPCSGLIG